MVQVGVKVPVPVGIPFLVIVLVELLVAVSRKNTVLSSVGAVATVGRGTVEGVKGSSPAGVVVVTAGLGTGGGEKVSSPEVLHLPLPVQVSPLRQQWPPRALEQRKAPAVHSLPTPLQVVPMGGQLADGNGGGEGDTNRTAPVETEADSP